MKAIKVKKIQPPGEISADDLRTIGCAIGGTHWQADLARAIGCSKSQITRVLDASRRADKFMAKGVHDEMLAKIEGLAALLNTDGLPNAKSVATRDAQKLVGEALKLMRPGTADYEASRGTAGSETDVSREI